MARGATEMFRDQANTNHCASHRGGLNDGKRSLWRGCRCNVLSNDDVTGDAIGQIAGPATGIGVTGRLGCTWNLRMLMARSSV